MSLLLSLALLLGMLPAAYAVAGLSVEITKLDPTTGDYEVTVSGGSDQTGAWAFALVPDVTVGGLTPSELITAGLITSDTQTKPNMQTGLNGANLPSGVYAVAGGSNLLFGKTYDQNGNETGTATAGTLKITGKLSAGSLENIKKFFGTTGYQTSQGGAYVTNIGSIPYKAILVTKKDTPELAPSAIENLEPVPEAVLSDGSIDHELTANIDVTAGSEVLIVDNIPVTCTGAEAELGDVVATLKNLTGGPVQVSARLNVPSGTTLSPGGNYTLALYAKESISTAATAAPYSGKVEIEYTDKASGKPKVATYSISLTSTTKTTYLTVSPITITVTKGQWDTIIQSGGAITPVLDSAQYKYITGGLAAASSDTKNFVSVESPLSTGTTLTTVTVIANKGTDGTVTQSVSQVKLKLADGIKSKGTGTYPTTLTFGYKIARGTAVQGATTRSVDIPVTINVVEPTGPLLSVTPGSASWTTVDDASPANFTLSEIGKAADAPYTVSWQTGGMFNTSLTNGTVTKGGSTSFTITPTGGVTAGSKYDDTLIITTDSQTLEVSVSVDIPAAEKLTTTLAIDSGHLTYNGDDQLNAAKGKVTVTASDGTELQQGTDYTISWSKGGTGTTVVTDAGTYTATVLLTAAGAEKYKEPTTNTGTVTVDPADVTVTMAHTGVYTGSAHTVNITVTGVKGNLTEGSDYDVSWNPNTLTDPNDYKATITLTGDAANNYNAPSEQTYTITKAQTTATISPASKEYQKGTNWKATAEAGITVKDESSNDVKDRFDITWTKEGESTSTTNLEEIGKYTGSFAPKDNWGDFYETPNNVVFEVTAPGNYTGTVNVTVGGVAPADGDITSVVFKRKSGTGSSEVTASATTGGAYTASLSYDSVYTVEVNGYSFTNEVKFASPETDVALFKASIADSITGGSATIGGAAFVVAPAGTTGLTLVATANANYEFASWSASAGTVTGTSSSATYTMSNSNATITLTFTALPALSVSGSDLEGIKHPYAVGATLLNGDATVTNSGPAAANLGIKITSTNNYSAADESSSAHITATLASTTLAKDNGSTTLSVTTKDTALGIGDRFSYYIWVYDTTHTDRCACLPLNVPVTAGDPLSVGRVSVDVYTLNDQDKESAITWGEYDTIDSLSWKGSTLTKGTDWTWSTGENKIVLKNNFLKTLTTADNGQAITVIGSKSGTSGTTSAPLVLEVTDSTPELKSVTLNPTTVLQPGDTVSITKIIAGTNTEVNLNDIGSKVTVEWYAGADKIAGQSGKDLTLTENEVNKVIRVVVTGNGTDYKGSAEQFTDPVGAKTYTVTAETSDGTNAVPGVTPTVGTSPTTTEAGTTVSTTVDEIKGYRFQMWTIKDNKDEGYFGDTTTDKTSGQAVAVFHPTANTTVVATYITLPVLEWTGAETVGPSVQEGKITSSTVAYQHTVKNVGKATAATVEYKLTMLDGSAIPDSNFALNTDLKKSDFAVNDEQVLTVKPKTDLKRGRYDLKLTVTYMEEPAASEGGEAKYKTIDKTFSYTVETPKYNVKVDETTGVTVTADGSNVPTAGVTVTDPGSLTVKATVTKGYRFDGWEVVKLNAGESDTDRDKRGTFNDATSATTSFTPKADVTIKAKATAIAILETTGETNRYTIDKTSNNNTAYSATVKNTGATQATEVSYTVYEIDKTTGQPEVSPSTRFTATRAAGTINSGSSEALTVTASDISTLDVGQYDLQVVISYKPTADGEAVTIEKAATLIITQNYFNSNVTVNVDGNPVNNATVKLLPTSGSAVPLTHGGGDANGVYKNTSATALSSTETYTVQVTPNGGTAINAGRVNAAAPDAVVDLYTVTLNKDSSGANPTFTGAGTYLKDTNVTVSTTVPNGYDFVNWTGTDEGTAPTTQTYTISKITAAKSFTANFKPYYTLAYNLQGGTGTVPAQTKYYGDTMLTEVTAPTKAGYKFTGWNTQADGKGTAITVDDTKDFATTFGAQTAGAAITLYAIWDAGTITYNGDTLAAGTYGEAGYTANVGTATNSDGVTGTFTYELASGSLPTGLELKSDGTITGTPSQTGDAGSNTKDITFTVKATNNSNGKTATATWTIPINKCEPTFNAATVTLDQTEGAKVSDAKLIVSITAPWHERNWANPYKDVVMPSISQGEGTVKITKVNGSAANDNTEIKNGDTVEIEYTPVSGKNLYYKVVTTTVTVNGAEEKPIPQLDITPTLVMDEITKDDTALTWSFTVSNIGGATTGDLSYVFGKGGNTPFEITGGFTTTALAKKGEDGDSMTFTVKPKDATVDVGTYIDEITVKGAAGVSVKAVIVYNIKDPEHFDVTVNTYNNPVTGSKAAADVTSIAMRPVGAANASSDVAADTSRTANSGIYTWTNKLDYNTAYYVVVNGVQTQTVVKKDTASPVSIDLYQLVLDNAPDTLSPTLTLTPSTGYYLPGQSVSVSTTAVTNYSFQGWKNDATDVNTALSFSYSMPEEATTLTAHYAAAYGVAFDTNGGSFTGTAYTDDKKYTDTDTVYVPVAGDSTYAISRDGYTFAGWATADDATAGAYAITIANLIAAASSAPAAGATLTLYAVWTANELSFSGGRIEGTYQTPITDTVVTPPTGGTGSYTYEEVIPGSGDSALPDGVTLNNDGTFSGTPTVTGTFTVTVKVQDDNSKEEKTAEYTLVIGKADTTVTTPPEMPGGKHAGDTVTADDLATNARVKPENKKGDDDPALDGTWTIQGYPDGVPVTDEETKVTLVFEPDNPNYNPPAPVTVTISGDYKKITALDVTLTKGHGQTAGITANSIKSGNTVVADGATVKATSWSPDTDPFVEGQDYTATVNLTPADGWKFDTTSDSWTAAGPVGAGAELTVVSVTPDLLTLQLYYGAKVTISSVGVTTSDPVANGTSTTVAPVDSTYKVKSTVWKTTDDSTIIGGSNKFTAGGQYEITVTLEPASDKYSFDTTTLKEAAASENATVNDNNAKIVSVSEKEIVISYQPFSVAEKTVVGISAEGSLDTTVYYAKTGTHTDTSATGHKVNDTTPVPFAWSTTSTGGITVKINYGDNSSDTVADGWKLVYGATPSAAKNHEMPAAGYNFTDVVDSTHTEVDTATYDGKNVYVQYTVGETTYVAPVPVGTLTVKELTATSIAPSRNWTTAELTFNPGADFAAPDNITADVKFNDRTALDNTVTTNYATDSTPDYFYAIKADDGSYTTVTTGTPLTTDDHSGKELYICYTDVNGNTVRAYVGTLMAKGAAGVKLLADGVEVPAGTPEKEAGTVLTAVPTGVKDPVYKWQEKGEDGTWKDIDGQTGPSYKTTADDVDKTIQVIVTEKDDSTITATSNPVKVKEKNTEATPVSHVDVSFAYVPTYGKDIPGTPVSVTKADETAPGEGGGTYTATWYEGTSATGTPATGTFGPGKQYTVVVKVKPETGYKYDDSTDFYFHFGNDNAAEALTVDATVTEADGVYSMTYTFTTKTANPPDGDKGVLGPSGGKVELDAAAKLYYAQTTNHKKVNTADNTPVPGGKKGVGFTFAPTGLDGARITYADDSVKTLNTDGTDDSNDATLEYGTGWSIVVGDSPATAIALPAGGVFTAATAAKYDGKKAYVKVGDVVIAQDVGTLTVKELTAETIAPTYAANKSAKDVLNYTAGGKFDASDITGATVEFNTKTDGLNVTYTGAAYANAAAIDQTKYYYQVWDGANYTVIKTDDQVGGTGTPVAEDGDILYICYKDINDHEVRSPIGTIRTTANTTATVRIDDATTGTNTVLDASYGNVLQAVVTGAEPGAKLTYQWQRWDNSTKKWENISGANGNYYTTVKDDVDNANPVKNLRVVVTEVGKSGDAKSSIDDISTAAGSKAAGNQQTQGVNVIKKTLTVGFTADSKPYDGTTDATVHPGALSGVVGKDKVNIKAGYSGTFGNAATVNTNQTVTLDGVVLEGNDADYYELTDPTDPEAQITKLAVSWGDLVFTVGKVKRYDSTTTVYAKDNASATANNANAVGAQSIGGTVDGVTVVDWASSTSLTTEQKNQLKNSGLKFSFAFESEDALGSGASKIIVTADKSTVSSDTFDFSGLTTTTIYDCTVNPKEITVGVNDLAAPSTTKDGNPYVTITGTVQSSDARTEGSDSFTFSVLGLFESTAESGSKTVTVQGVDANSSAGITWTDKNYTPKWTGDKEKTGTVTGGEVTGITVNTAPTGTYGNAYSTATGLQVSVVFDNKPETTMVCHSFSELENLGVKTIVEDKKSGTEYYFATDPGKTIGWEGNSTSATLNLKFYKGAAGETKTAAEAWNDPGTVTANSTLTVNPRPITASASWKITEGSDEYTAKYYDGTANATGSLWPSGTAKDTTGTGAATVTVTPLTGDTVTATYTGAAFQTAGVGTNKTIKVTGIFLGGAQAGRYKLANTTADAIGDIVARPITVTFDEPSVVVKSDETIYKTQEFNGTNGEKLDVSATLTFASTDAVADGVTVTVTDPIWNNPNYTVTVEDITGDVTAKAISNVIVTYDQPEKDKKTTDTGFVSPTGFNNIAEITQEGATIWKQGNDLNASDGVTGDTFAAGQKYVVTTVVKAKFDDGYVFDNNTVFNLSGGSVKATDPETTMSVTITDNGQTATVKELLTVPEDSTIAHVVGGIPEPTPGTSTGTNGSTSSVITTKGTSVTPADGLTNAAPAVTWFVENDGGTGWDSFTGTFDYGKQYKAEITYTAKTGYSFAGDVDFVINNIGPVTDGNTTGTGVTLTAAKTGGAYKLTIVFPKAGSQNLTNVVVNTILPPMHGDTVPSVWVNKGEPYEGVTNTLKWQVSDNGTSGWNDVAAGTSFEAGKYYRVTGQVQLTETEKYDITTSTKFYMGDIEIPQAGVNTSDYEGTFTATNSAKGDGSYDDETKYTLTLTYKAALTDNTDKSVIRVAANVLQPVAEQTPAAAVSVTVAQNKLGESMLDGVTANDLKWYDVADDTTPLAADATFAKDATYKAVFTLSADTANDYSFLSADPDYVDFLVNNVLKDGNWINGADTAEHGEGDGKITVTTVKKNDNSYEVTVIFPKTAEKADILTVWATADVPTAGTKAQDAAMNVADSEPYEIVENGIKWFEKGQPDPLGATDTFTAGKTYTAQITVKLKDSATAYTFTEDTEGYINDTTKDTAEYDGTAETVTVTRDFTVELASTGPVLLTVTDPVSGGDPTAAAYDAAKVDASAKFDIVTDHGWTKADGSAVGSTFEAGQTYKVTVDVKAQEGYKLPEALSSYYMNSIPGAGSASSNVYVKALTGDDAGKYQVVYTYAIPATSQANQVGVAVTRPVTGETAQSAKPSDPDKYEIVDTKWTGGGKTDAEPGFKFAEKTAYTVKVTVQGKDGVTIKPGDTFYFNGEQIAADKVKDLGGGKYEMTHTFPATAAESTGTDTPTPPVVIPGGTTTIEKEKPVVTYWISEKGVTNDLTAEKVEEGGKPSFTPKVTAKEEGYVFAGWSESDPTKVKDPKLVNPLTYTITADKTFYAVYKEDKPEVAKHEHYVKGYPGGVFVPDGSISRGEVAAIIARSCLAGYVEGANYGNAGYTDLEGHWAKSAIVFCTLSGILTGYGDGTFRPDAPISRQEFAVAFARMAGIQTSKGLTFTDAADIADWAEDGVYTCKANGWIEGYADGSFRPWQNITRAESVKIMNAFLHRGVNEAGLSELKGDYKTWPDVPKTHWAYYEILEAANDHDYYYVDPDKAVPPEHWTDAYVGEVSWGG